MREEYKMTEFGEIPVTWDIIPIYELRNKTDRYSFTGGPFGSDLKSEHYTTEGVKVIQLQDIGEGVFINKSVIFISEEKADELASSNIFPNDIILAKMAPVARCCKIPAGVKRYVMSSDGIRLSVDTTRFDNEFVFQALNSNYFRKEAEAQSTGTTRARIGLNDLKLIPILMPSQLQEQNKIAEILSVVDDKIQLIQKQIKETEALKKGLMQKLLTKGIGNIKFKESQWGEIPEQWDFVKLESITEKIGDGLHATPKYVAKSDYYFVNGNNLVNGKVVVNEKTKCISKEEFDKYYRELSVNTILLSINGTIGNVAYYNNEKVILGKSAAYICCNENLDTDFLFYYLQSNAIKEFYRNELTGSTISNLSLKSIRNIPIPLMSKNEQQQIVKILITVDEKLEILLDKKDGFQELKNGLMQQLLTAKLRVKIN